MPKMMAGSWPALLVFSGLTSTGLRIALLR